MEWGRLEKNWQVEAFRQQTVRWARTPYMKGQRCPGVGADCVNFVLGFLDGLTGLTTPTFASPPTALRELAQWRLVPLEGLQEETMPGDIWLCGPSAELHLYLAGLQPDTWWHCSNTGVCLYSTARLKVPFRRAFRPVGKSLWLPPTD